MLFDFADYFSRREVGFDQKFFGSQFHGFFLLGKFGKIRKHEYGDVLEQGILADGAKHFLLSNRHQGVIATQRIPAAVYGEAEYGVSAFATPASLQVRLESDEAAALGCDVIDVLDLATRVIEYWRRRGVR